MSFLQIIVLFILNHYFVSRKFTIKWIGLFILLSGIAAFSFNYIEYFVMFIVLLCLMILNKLQGESITFSIIVPSYTLTILVLSDHFSSFINLHIFHVSFETLTTDTFYSSLHAFVFICIATILGLLTKLAMNKIQKNFRMIKNYGWFIVVLIVMTVIVIYMNIFLSARAGFSRDTIQINTLVFFIYFVIFIVVMGILFNSIVKEIRVQNKQEEYKQLRTYSENLEEMYSELQKFRHDYINILASMSQYILNDDMGNLEKYFNERVVPISRDIKLNNHKLSALKNIKITEIKGTLVAKLIKAQDLHIDITIEATEPIEEIHMDYLVLCRCLGIILDNAVEETQNQKNSKIIAAFINKESSTLLVVINTIHREMPQLHKIFEKGFSTKGENRGLGLSNLNELVSSCKRATLNTKIENQLFYQEIEIMKEMDQ